MTTILQLLTEFRMDNNVHCALSTSVYSYEAWIITRLPHSPAFIINVTLRSS